MKKIVMLAFIFLFVQAIYAQGDIRFGFHLSPAVSWLNTDHSKINSSGPNIGLKLGLNGEYYFRDNYAVSSGIGFHFNAGGTLLHQYGGFYWTKTDLSGGLDTMSMSNNVKLKYSIQYVEIPIGLKMRTKEFGFFRYFLDPAITLGFKTQARGVITDSGLTGEEDEKYDIRKEVNGINATWGLTGGAEYNLGENSTLVFGAGFQIGFTDLTDDNGTVFDPDKGNRDEDSKGLFRSIVLKLGVMF